MLDRSETSQEKKLTPNGKLVNLLGHSVTKKLVGVWVDAPYSGTKGNILKV